jgi:hypothetical protein
MELAAVPSFDHRDLPEGLSFGELLDVCLTRGIRSPMAASRGKRWTKEDFAEQVGRSERQVRNWVAGRSVPHNDDEVIVVIERILFGLDKNYMSDWRLELRESVKRSNAEKHRGENRPTGATARGQSRGNPPAGNSAPDYPEMGIRQLHPLTDSFEIPVARDIESDIDAILIRSASAEKVPSRQWLKDALRPIIMRAEAAKRKLEEEVHDLNERELQWYSRQPEAVAPRNDLEAYALAVKQWYDHEIGRIYNQHRYETNKARSFDFISELFNTGRAPAENVEVLMQISGAKIIGDQQEFWRPKPNVPDVPATIEITEEFEIQRSTSKLLQSLYPENRLLDGTYYEDAIQLFPVKGVERTFRVRLNRLQHGRSQRLRRIRIGFGYDPPSPIDVKCIIHADNQPTAVNWEKSVFRPSIEAKMD